MEIRHMDGMGENGGGASFEFRPGAFRLSAIHVDTSVTCAIDCQLPVYPRVRYSSCLGNCPASNYSSTLATVSGWFTM